MSCRPAQASPSDIGLPALSLHSRIRHRRFMFVLRHRLTSRGPLPLLVHQFYTRTTSWSVFLLYASISWYPLLLLDSVLLACACSSMLLDIWATAHCSWSPKMPSWMCNRQFMDPCAGLRGGKQDLGKARCTWSLALSIAGMPPRHWTSRLLQQRSHLARTCHASTHLTPTCFLTSNVLVCVLLWQNRLPLTTAKALGRVVQQGA